MDSSSRRVGSEGTRHMCIYEVGSPYYTRRPGTPTVQTQSGGMSDLTKAVLQPAEGQAFEATRRGMIIVVGCGMYAGCGGERNMKQGENREELAGSVGHKSVEMLEPGNPRE